MPLNLYNYYSGPNLVGVEYQGDIPAVAFDQLKSRVATVKKGRNREDDERLAIGRYRHTIVKDPDLAIEFANMYLNEPLWPKDEKFAANNASKLSGLIDYMQKYGNNEFMQARIERDGSIQDLMHYSQRILRRPLDSRFNEKILTASPLDIALYAGSFAKFKKPDSDPLPESLWTKAQERILENLVAISMYMIIARRRWPKGERLLLQDYARNPDKKHSLISLINDVGKAVPMDDFIEKVDQISAKHESQT